MPETQISNKSTITPQKAATAVPNVFKWIFLGIFQTLIFIIMVPIDILEYTFKGLVKSFYILTEVLVLAYRGFVKAMYTVFYDWIYGLFNASSSQVYNVYQTTTVAKDKTSTKLDEFKEKVSVWYNNLEFVKKQQEKLEFEKEQLLKELNETNVKRAVNPTVYRYKVKDRKGKIITGTFDGFSKADVNAFLLNEGYIVYSIKCSKWIDFVYGNSTILGNSMSTKDLVFWLTQLSTYVKAGITLTEAVRILSRQMGKKGHKKKMFDSIIFELMMGQSFSTALERQGDVFPNLLINMIRAAEATGELEATLADMAEYYTDIETTRKQMISALTYPAMVSIFAFIVIGFIMIYVVPSFCEVYTKGGIEIEGLTLTIVNISNYLEANISKIILVFIGIVVAIVFLYKKLKKFRYGFQYILMHIPLIKDIIIYKELSIFAKTFSSLLKNNVYITESIGILSKITNNEIYRDIMFKTISNIARGEKISDAFYEHWAVPDVAYQMIVTGESTGELAEMMEAVSHYYQESHKNIITSLKSVIEPVMIIALAVVVGIVVLAVIIPMFDLYGSISEATA